MNAQRRKSSVHRATASQDIKVFGQWFKPARIERNNFKFKSLSNWSYNISVGCVHACPFCYVPEVSAIKIEKAAEKNLRTLIPTVWRRERANGGHWADSHWGNFCLLRPWDEKAFRSSLRSAIKDDERGDLPKDGNKAIMFCSTTDAYQTIAVQGDLPKRKLLNGLREALVRNALKIIFEESDLNVRILTRSPLAKADFDLYERFGKRLAFGMSFPTTDEALSSLYEPASPGPTVKMKTLQEAVARGLNVFVAFAPTMPDQSEKDLRTTLEAIARLKPMTIFHEPINLRAENAKRIADVAAKKGKSVRTEVFLSNATWREYAFERFSLVDRIAHEMRLPEGVLHQWPDPDLATESGFMEMKLMQASRTSNTQRLSSLQIEEAKKGWGRIKAWIDYWHNPDERISSWPGIRMPRWR